MLGLAIALWLMFSFKPVGIFWRLAIDYWYIAPISMLCGMGIGLDWWVGLTGSAIVCLIVSINSVLDFPLKVSYIVLTNNEREHNV